MIYMMTTQRADFLFVNSVNFVNPVHFTGLSCGTSDTRRS